MRITAFTLGEDNALGAGNSGRREAGAGDMDDRPIEGLRDYIEHLRQLGYRSGTVTPLTLI